LTPEVLLLRAALLTVAGLTLGVTGMVRASGPPSCMGQTPNDSAVIAALEHTWLQTGDTTVLRQILAPDFVHIAPGGYILTRAQHLAWVATHPRKRGVRVRFGSLRVRLYGDAAVANGIVVAADTTGRVLWRNAFTDVFVKRSGRWQAVNAQEDVMTGAK
jgi:hypothetical protein